MDITKTSKTEVRCQNSASILTGTTLYVGVNTGVQIVNEAIGTGDGTTGAISGDFRLYYSPMVSLSDIAAISVGATSYTPRTTITGTGREVKIDLSTGWLQFYNAGAAINVTGAILGTYTPSRAIFTPYMVPSGKTLRITISVIGVEE